MRSALPVLRLPGFRRLAIGYLVNELGDWLGIVALAVLVYDQTGSPLATAGLFLASQFLPALVGPALVARLELWGAGRSLAWLYASEAIVFAALGLTAESFVLALIIVLATVDGALNTAARALTRGATGAILVPAGMLREGNAVLNIGFTAGAAVGPALAGLLVGTAGVQAALFADAASFLAVAFLVAPIGRISAVSNEGDWRIRLRDGFRYVRERAALRRLLGVQAVAFVFYSSILPIEVVFAKETLGAGDAGYGALLASWGAGMVVGSLLFAALRRADLRLLLAISALAIGCAYLGTAASSTLLIACIASAVGGTGNGVLWVSLVSALQELSRPSYHARVISLLESTSTAMPGIGFILGGAITAILDPRAAYVFAGAAGLVALAVGIFVLRGVSWAPDRDPDDGESAAEPAGKAARSLLDGGPEWAPRRTPQTPSGAGAPGS